MFIILIIVSLILPATMLLLGIQYGNADYDSMLAYRSKRSSRNRDTWEFAHLYAGKLLRAAGAALLVLTLFPALLLLFSDLRALSYFTLIIIILQLATAAILFIAVEIKLDDTFDEYGFRKTDE